MFIKTKDRLVNLQNVSNVKLIEEKNKVIFNMNYSIKLNEPTLPYSQSALISKSKETKAISDYAYWTGNTKNEYNSYIEEINNNIYFCTNFVETPNKQAYVNVNEISSLKYFDHDYRVIFNLSHPVSFKNKDGLTSEFVLANCENKKQFYEYKTLLETKIL